MDDFYFAVNPVLDYPHCIKSGKNQDCPSCGLSEKCTSPRRLCARPYPGHKKGCPNYGMKPGCPPNAPVFDQVFDMTKTIYAVFCTFDLGAHVIKMRSRHPGWTEKQLRNMLYWQGTAGKMLRMNIRKFNALYGKDGYFAVMSPEAMGVDVTRTMKNIGIELEWPVVNTVYKIAMAGIPKDPKYARIFVE